MRNAEFGIKFVNRRAIADRPYTVCGNQKAPLCKGSCPKGAEGLSVAGLRICKRSGASSANPSVSRKRLPPPFTQGRLCAFPRVAAHPLCAVTPAK